LASSDPRFERFSTRGYTSKLRRCFSQEEWLAVRIGRIDVIDREFKDQIVVQGDRLGSHGEPSRVAAWQERLVSADQEGECAYRAQSFCV
jgi:hypothetical protein